MKGLFLITGVGLGNATRCQALMEELNGDFDLQIMASGKAYEFFHRLKKWPLDKLEQLPYSLTSGLYGAWKNNRNLVMRKLRTEEFSFIIIDSEYSLLGSQVAPTVFSLSSVRGINFHTLPMINKRNIIQFSVEQLDLLAQRMIPDFVIRPDWVHTPEYQMRTVTVPPIVRRRLRAHAKSSKPLTVGFMLSGSSLENAF